MRFFTPERFVALQRLDDRDAFLDAHGAWEQAAADYEARLKSLIPQFSTSVRRLVDLGSLHDSELRAVWHGRSRLTVVLDPGGNSPRLTLLTYSLAAPAGINGRVLPPEIATTRPLWLYDELGIEAAASDGNGSPPQTVYTHDILVSNGSEMHLRFINVNVSQPLKMAFDGEHKSAPLPRTA